MKGIKTAVSLAASLWMPWAVYGGELEKAKADAELSGTSLALTFQAAREFAKTLEMREHILPSPTGAFAGLEQRFIAVAFFKRLHIGTGGK